MPHLYVHGGKYAGTTTGRFGCDKQSPFPFRASGGDDRCTTTADEGDTMHTIQNGHALLAPGEGETLEARGTRLVIKVANASQLICEYTAPAHFPGPPMHVHPGFDETFILLAGHLELVIRDQVTELVPGATGYVKGSVPHTFRNPGGDSARFLLLCSPGGFEHYFRGVATGDEELIAATCERFGYRPVEMNGDRR